MVLSSYKTEKSKLVSPHIVKNELYLISIVWKIRSADHYRTRRTGRITDVMSNAVYQFFIQQFIRFAR